MNEPDILYDDDGTPVHVRWTEAVNTPAKALRYIVEHADGPDAVDYIERGLWDEAYDREGPILLSWYRGLRDSVTVVYMRPAEEGDEVDPMWGDEAWVLMHPDHLDARGRMYWEVGAWTSGTRMAENG